MSERHPSSPSEHQLCLLADLCMVAQGFHPAPDRTAALIAEGYVWVMVAKPPKHGLTELGKRQLVCLVCEGTSLTPSALSDAAKQVDSSVTGFAAASAFLDEVETQARCGHRVAPTAEQGGCLSWLLSTQPSQPPKAVAKASGGESSAQH